MEPDDHQSVARFHLTAFLDVANPIAIHDTTDSASRKTHTAHCAKTRAFILRAHEFFKENDIADMTPRFLSAMLSIHKDTVHRVISDSTTVVPLNRFPPCGPPPLKITKKAVQERIKGRFSEETIQQLRRFVHVQYFAQYKRVTLKKICDRSDEWIDPKDKDISMSPSILRLLLHAINFSWVKLQYRSNIYMNDYYCRVQSHFLRTMMAIREEGNHLIWSVDETWVHKGMRPGHGWQDMEAAKAPLTFIKNGMTEFEKYIEGVFKELVAEAEEKNLKPILLMDNASYHSRVIDKMPTQSDRKTVMANWLKAHDMPCPDGWKKKDMVEALKKLTRKDYNKYVVDTMGEQYGVQVVRTPPYMAEYAPIEFGWSAMKRAQHDLITHTDDGRKRIEEGALTFSPSLSTEEIVAAAEDIIDEADEQPVEDLEELLYMFLDNALGEMRYKEGKKAARIRSCAAKLARAEVPIFGAFQADKSAFVTTDLLLDEVNVEIGDVISNKVHFNCMAADKSAFVLSSSHEGISDDVAVDDLIFGKITATMVELVLLFRSTPALTPRPSPSAFHKPEARMVRVRVMDRSRR
ncbi:hypothetical protein PRIPAC_75696 [Pristionchus pacificus]|uniref:Uncharacterized protein n=1 Tax=Pristionchus pacificus TaxID=54126 RepID=A0A2A6BGB0_PRIPA|nr:hypothetical protein PRIPAC_75696 [Pristionchus pacificus]|eukprot:PDM64888.1 hypothetical protein PRIPAC_53144 [Pristionchus pacificus]